MGLPPCRVAFPFPPTRPSRLLRLRLARRPVFPVLAGENRVITSCCLAFHAKGLHLVISLGNRTPCDRGVASAHLFISQSRGGG